MPGHAVGEEPFPNIQLKALWRSFSRSPSPRVFPPPLPLTAVPALVSPQGGSRLPSSPSRTLPPWFPLTAVPASFPASQGRSLLRFPSRPFPPPFQPLRAVPLRAVPASPQPLTAVPALVSPQGGSRLPTPPHGRSRPRLSLGRFLSPFHLLTAIPSLVSSPGGSRPDVPRTPRLVLPERQPGLAGALG